MRATAGDSDSGCPGSLLHPVVLSWLPRQAFAPERLLFDSKQFLDRRKMSPPLLRGLRTPRTFCLSLPASHPAAPAGSRLTHAGQKGRPEELALGAGLRSATAGPPRVRPAPSSHALARPKSAQWHPSRSRPRLGLREMNLSIFLL